ncbi:MAG: hypothetical protein RBT81_11080 [Gammaproteobacteria bacterium]|jgi:hypothetical protein|nr:hypothetical protein [Gammaproteobacteria bacterium]
MSVQVHRPAAVEEAPGLTARRIEPVPVAEGAILGWEQFSLAAGAGRKLSLAPGSETIVYVLSGALRLSDVPGIGGAVVAGGAQWLATGRKILPLQTAVGGISAKGIRFSLRLPRHRIPGIEFLQLDAGGLPLVPITGGCMRTIADADVGLHPVAALRCFDVQLEPGAVWNAALPEAAFALIYMVTGSAAIIGRDIDEAEAGIVEDERLLRLEARESCRFVGMVGERREKR